MERVMIALDDENYGKRSLAWIDAPTKRKRSAEEDSLFFGEAEGRRSPHPTHHVDYKRRQQQQNDTTNETLRTISTFRLDLTMEKMMIMDDPVVQ